MASVAMVGRAPKRLEDVAGSRGQVRLPVILDATGWKQLAETEALLAEEAADLRRKLEQRRLQNAEVKQRHEMQIARFEQLATELLVAGNRQRTVTLQLQSQFRSILARRYLEALAYQDLRLQDIGDLRKKLASSVRQLYNVVHEIATTEEDRLVAATMMQSWWRGTLERRFVNAIKLMRSICSTKDQMAREATLIQRCYRQIRARREILKERQRREQRMLEERGAQGAMQAKLMAKVIMLQAAARGFLGRKRAQRLRVLKQSRDHEITGDAGNAAWSTYLRSQRRPTRENVRPHQLEGDVDLHPTLATRKSRVARQISEADKEHTPTLLQRKSKASIIHGEGITSARTGSSKVPFLPQICEDESIGKYSRSSRAGTFGTDARGEYSKPRSSMPAPVTFRRRTPIHTPHRSTFSKVDEEASDEAPLSANTANSKQQTGADFVKAFSINI